MPPEVLLLLVGFGELETRLRASRREVASGLVTEEDA